MHSVVPFVRDDENLNEVDVYLVGGFTYRTQNNSSNTEPFDVFSNWNGR